MDTSFEADITAVQRIDAVPRILDIVCRLTGMGFAAVARVTEGRWICCAVRDDIAFGLQPGGELKVETTICNEIRQSHEAVVIDHVSGDKVYCDHPTPALYGFQSYISVPIILPDGRFFGTLCAIDPRPARLNNPETIGTINLFAELIATHLNALAQLETSEASLLSERQASELREQFIAVLGHDLRNPLASIAAGVQLLTKVHGDDKTTKIIGLMQKSVTSMSQLIDNVLDFARGRLGGGLAIQKELTEPTQGFLDQVVDEFRSTHPEADIKTQFDVNGLVDCDRHRLARLFSNLLGNAITHGSPHKPIMVEANTNNEIFELSVTNSGAPIPPAAMSQLFQPFYRGNVRKSLQGLGLGLFIASEIARAHAGTLEVSSANGETCFTFRMPTSSRTASAA
jgi:signal transduction histidine kinase